MQTQAVELHNQHRQFLQKCSGVREQVTRLTGIARMLADTGHFAGQQMLKQVISSQIVFLCLYA